MAKQSLIRFFSLLGILLWSTFGAVVSAHDAPTVKPRGELLATVTVVSNAFGQKPKGKTSWEFYVVNVPGVYGPTLDGFQYQNGELVAYVSAGSESKAVIDAVNAVGLRPFDFDADIKSSSNPIDKVVLDGLKIEIRVMTPSGELRLEQWNPGYLINGHAQRSSDIEKLKIVLDILALYIGRFQMRI